jgi:hypothetical protein
MSHTYNFAIHDEQGAVRKAMPPMTLAEDSEALAFAARVIAEMINGEVESYLGWTLEITEGERLVASVPVGTAVVTPIKDKDAAPVAESSEFKRAALTTAHSLEAAQSE